MSNSRLLRLRNFMKEHGIDAVALRNNADLRWITSANKVFDSEQAHTAFITENELFLHTDSRYIEAFKKQLKDKTEWQIDEDRISHAKWIAKKALETKSFVVGIEDTLTIKFHSDLKAVCDTLSAPVHFVCMHGDILKMRAVKDEEEIEAIKKAQAVADKGFEYILGQVSVGRTEKEVQIDLENYLKKHGADDLSFGTIMASGPNGASPHAIPTDRKLQKGDFVTMDFGVRLNDYCSDMTRTVILGKPSEKQKLVYDTVLKANQECAKRIKPGVITGDLHAYAEKIIADAGFDGAFRHGLGHGVGIEVHELPIFARSNSAKLEVGNVVTDEPGIYLPGEFGVRIEDFGVVREDGFEIITQSPRELIEL